MINDSLPQKPTTDQLSQKAQWFGSLILITTFPEERRAIVDYGSKLLAGAGPTDGQIMRFHACLKALSPNLPCYGEYIARMSLYPATISRFQGEIARCVASHHAAHGGY